MIKISRQGVDGPPSLVEDDGVGRQEVADNTEGFADYLVRKQTDPDAAEEKYSFSFKAYRRREVKEALVALSHGKCAYCEKRFAATQPVDVEHWRPKGEVVRDKGEKALGYYWLAAEWDNLLPSCIDCNRARKQESALDGSLETLGKKNQFPVWREDDRWRDPEAPNEEVPLLLHPYFDEPDEILAFDDEGVARPREEPPALPDGAPTHNARAEASIRVYALNRVALVHERKALLLRIERIKLTVVHLMTLLAALEEASGLDHASFWRELVMQILDQELEELAALVRPESEFAGLARERVASFLEQMKRPAR